MDRIWIAFYQECMRGYCDSAVVIIRAPSREEAESMARTWSDSIKIRFNTVEEFTEQSRLVDAHYS